MRRSSMDPPILYSRCWEDSHVLRQALRVGPGDRVLSIASAGDNSFELLLDDPERVVMIDRHPTQLALVHLKMAAIAHMSPEDVRRFLGLEPSNPDNRRQWYTALRKELPPFAQAKWDKALHVIESGVLDVGKFERYLATFREWILPLVQWPSTVKKMCSLTDTDAQKRLYEEQWDTWRWRALFGLFFSRWVMERRGRQKEFFDHVAEQRISDVFRLRAQKGLVEMPVATNPYLRWILDQANLVPPYLSDEHMPTIAARLNRIEIVDDDVAAHLASVGPNTYAAYNLSDCLEYMDTATADSFLRAAVAASCPGARLAYWNLLVTRDGSAVDQLKQDRERSQRLHKVDRAFFYGRFVVEEVVGGT